jgi:hypothetical protein
MDKAVVQLHDASDELDYPRRAEAMTRQRLGRVDPDVSEVIAEERFNRSALRAIT